MKKSTLTITKAIKGLQTLLYSNKALTPDQYRHLYNQCASLQASDMNRHIMRDYLILLSKRIKKLNEGA